MWTSHAPSVPGVYGLGDTAAEAEADLAEAMDLMFSYTEELVARGTTERGGGRSEAGSSVR